MAIAVTVADVRIKFTEFSDVLVYTDTMIQQSIDLGLSIMSGYRSIPDTTGTFMALYLTAHNIALAYRSSLGDVTGLLPIASKSLGPASTEYQTGNERTTVDSTYGGTTYGRQFLLLLNTWKNQYRPVMNLYG